MDGPPNIVFDDWIDWSKVDLLDACYLPADAGLELGGDIWLTPTETSYTSPAYDGSGNWIQTPAEEGLKVRNMEVFGSWACDHCDLHFPGFKELSLHLGYWFNCNGANGSFNCITCGETLALCYSLDSHGKSKRHATIACCYIGCEQQFVTHEERGTHHQIPHTIGHARLFTATLFDCAQCNQSFESSAQIKRHSQEEQHQPYGCQCGIMFSRLDVLNRHLKSLGTNLPEYPCKYCRRHRGENGFRRLDHLNQHIRNYHHHEENGQPIVPGGPRRQLKFVYPVCSFEGCPDYRGPEFQQLPRPKKEANKPFRSQSEYSKHMREEHDTCPYPCDVPGCNRIGRRGYFREKDLIKHRNQSHPEAGPYRAARREMTHACTEPGCDSVLTAISMKAHYEWVHSQWL